MRARTYLPSLSVALCLCVVTLPAVAQLTGSPPTGAPSPAPSAASAALTRWDARPIGKYDIELTLPDRVMQVELTVADSAGHLTATFRPVGDRDGHEMRVTVKDTDLLLHAETPRGLLDIVLQRQAARASPGGGRWARSTARSRARSRTRECCRGLHPARRRRLGIRFYDAALPLGGRPHFADTRLGTSPLRFPFPRLPLTGRAPRGSGAPPPARRRGAAPGRPRARRRSGRRARARRQAAPR